MHLEGVGLELSTELDFLLIPKCILLYSGLGWGGHHFPAEWVINASGKRGSIGYSV